MKAMLWTKYGPPDVFQLADIEKPIPKDNEILVKVHAATVTAGDCELRGFNVARWIWLPLRLYIGIRKPRIEVLGQEFAGEVMALGKDIHEVEIGDKIFAEAGMKMGGYAQYTCLSTKRTHAKIPTNMTFAEAATIPTGGLNALHFVRKGNITIGDRVLINGAGGSIGTYAVQLAKLEGAHVTSVDSQRKLAMLTKIGSDEVINYQKEDFTKNGQTYDVIIDIVGKSPYDRSVRSLNPNGRYILGNPSFSGMMRGIWTSKFTNKKVISALAGYTTEDFLYLRDLIETGLLKSVIDRTFDLIELSEAHQYVEDGLKIGNVVIDMMHE